MLKERPILFSAPMVRAILAGTKTQTRHVVKPQPPDECTHTGPVMGTYSGVPVPRFYWQTAEDYDHAEELDKEFVYWPAADDEESDGFTGDVYGLGGLECPFGTGANCMKAADRLWVRETFFAFGRWETRHSAKKGRDEWHFIDMTLDAGKAYGYAADGDGLWPMPGRRQLAGATPSWWKRPAIFMPRAASRITLEITGADVERLNDISDADAEREGTPCYVCGGKLDGLSEADCHCFHRKATASDFRGLWESINGAESWEANLWVWVVEFRRVTG